MRRAIIHVGLPRTGTTTFQRVLSRLRPALLQAGILYPELTPAAAPSAHLSHQHLGEVLDGRRPGRERRELLDRLGRTLEETPAETLLLSYEGLCMAPSWRRIPATLAALLARHGFAPEVLATIKPQAEYLNSTYTWRTQFLREHRRFPDYVRAEIGSVRLDLGRLLGRWRRLGPLTVVPMRDPRSDRPLVERIVAAVGLLPQLGALITADDLGLVDNRSPGPVAVEVARRLRQGGVRLRGAAAREATRFAETAAQARGLDATPFRGVDAAVRAEAEQRWAAANERFAAEIWGEPWAVRVASEPARPVNDLTQQADPALLREVEAILVETCRHAGLSLGSGLGAAVQRWRMALTP